MPIRFISIRYVKGSAELWVLLIASQNSAHVKNHLLSAVPRSGRSTMAWRQNVSFLPSPTWDSVLLLLWSQSVAVATIQQGACFKRKLDQPGPAFLIQKYFQIEGTQSSRQVVYRHIASQPRRVGSDSPCLVYSPPARVSSHDQERFIRPESRELGLLLHFLTWNCGFQ